MEKHTDVERDGVGYSKPLPKRRRASSLTQGKTENSTSNKRSRQSSKLEESTKSPFDDSKSVKSKPVNRKPVSQGDPEEPKSEEPTSEAEKVQQKQYFVLPTKRINLVCSFCETVTLSKRELSQHLLSLHGDEIITFKSLWLPHIWDETFTIFSLIYFLRFGHFLAIVYCNQQFYFLSFYKLTMTIFFNLQFLKNPCRSEIANLSKML